MSAAVKPIPHAIDAMITYDAAATPVAWRAMPSSDTFGVPRRPHGPTRSGSATLMSVPESVAAGLIPGELLLAEDSAGLYAVRVGRVRTAVAGDHGAEYECLVVDARDLEGRCLTYAPDDLLDVEVDG